MKMSLVFTTGIVIVSTLASAQYAVKGDRPPKEIPSVRIRASELIGYPVVDAEGTEIGRISDFRIGSDGTVPFITLQPQNGSPDGTDGIAISSRIVTWSLPLGRGFVRADEPAYRSGNSSALPGTDMNATTLMRSVVRQNDFPGAVAADFMVDAVDWKIIYVALTALDAAGSSKTFYAVPFELFTLTGNSLSFRAPGKSFQGTVGFDSKNWPVESDPYWTNRNARRSK